MGVGRLKPGRCLNLTAKQREILELVLKAADSGEFIDMDQLVERVSYETTKGSMQFSIRALVHHGLVFKTVGTKLVTEPRKRYKSEIVPTQAAYLLIRGGTLSA